MGKVPSREKALQAMGAWELMWIPKDSGVLVCNVSHQVAIKSSCGGDGRPALKAQGDNYRRQAENQGGRVSQEQTGLVTKATLGTKLLCLSR